MLELYSEGQETDDGGVNYITEQELRRIWSEASDTAMGKPLSSFSVEEALLLLPDKEADDLMFHDEGQSLAADAAALLENEGTELYVTDQELEAVWNSRGEVQWGMPDGKEKAGFDPKLALLLLDAEDEDEELQKEKPYGVQWSPKETFFFLSFFCFFFFFLSF